MSLGGTEVGGEEGFILWPLFLDYCECVGVQLPVGPG